MAQTSLVGRSAGIAALAAVTIGAVVSMVYVGALWLVAFLVMVAIGIVAATAALQGD